MQMILKEADEKLLSKIQMAQKSGIPKNINDSKSKGEDLWS